MSWTKTHFTWITEILELLILTFKLQPLEKVHFMQACTFLATQEYRSVFLSCSILVLLVLKSTAYQMAFEHIIKFWLKQHLFFRILIVLFMWCMWVWGMCHGQFFRSVTLSPIQALCSTSSIPFKDSPYHPHSCTITKTRDYINIFQVFFQLLSVIKKWYKYYQCSFNPLVLIGKSFFNTV